MDKWKQKETEIGKVEIQTDRMCEDTPHTEMSAWCFSGGGYVGYLSL